MSGGTDNAPPPPAPRRRRWRWLAGIALASMLLIVLVLLWALKTGSGRDAMLAQAARFLPPDALSWRAAEGSLIGGLVLHEVRYAAEGVTVELERVELDVAGGPLWSGTIHVRHLMLAQGRVLLPVSEDDDAPPPARIELPDSLPDLVLPVDVRVDALDARDIAVLQGEASVLVVHRLKTAAALANGAVELRDFTLESDRIGMELAAGIDTARNWANDVTAEARLMLEGAQPLPVSLRLHGDLDDLTLDAQADAGEAATLHFNARGGLPNPTWALQLDAPRLLPERLGIAGEAMALALNGEGDLAQARLSGRFAQGALEVTLSPSQVSYRNATLTLAPLALGIYHGTAEVNGDIDLSQADPHLALALAWRDIVLPGEAGAPSVRTRGPAHATGPLEAYALTLDGVFARGEEQARVTLQGQGSTRDLALSALEAQLPGGGLKASGHVAWDPAVEGALDARLQAFDPSYFVPDLPGAIDARLTLRGGIGDAGPHGELALDDLSGHLRGRALGGSAHLVAGQNGHGQGEAALALGDSHVRAQGRWGDTLDIDAALDPVLLGDLLPDARGQASGRITLRGPKDAPTLSAQLDGEELRIEGQAVERLRLRAEITAWDRGTVSVEASDATLGGQRVETLSLSGEGSRARHEVALAASGPLGTLGLDLSGALDARGTLWRGTLGDLHLAPAERTAWRLREPASLSYAPEDGALALSRACLDAAPAWLCAEIRARGATSEGEVELDGLALSELDPLLAAALEQPAALSGQLAAKATFVRSANGDIVGEASATLPRVGMKLDADSERALLDLSEVRLSATLSPAQARLRLDAVASDSGYIRASLDADTPMQDDGALAGQVDLLLPDLLALELFTDQVVDPDGRVEGRLAIGGTRASPQLDGALELLDFSAELPALGIAPREGRITLSSNSARQAQLAGSLLLGEGRVAIDGRLDLAAEGGPGGTVSIAGENLTVMQVPEAHVRASPDLRLELGKGALKVRGSVVVPFARIDLERLESVTTPSSDVVIVDAPQAGGGLAIDTDVSVTLGESVRMNGFGLKGTLAGTLRVRDRPGRATTARGAIEVGGAYKAYGQDLTITRGHVAWASTPIDMPTLDIRAQRKIDAVTVGVQVRGTALVPELSLWSDPAMEQAEQLSYLVLGRPLRSASQADGAQLTQAAAALGGNLLAQNLGARLGLDEVEVADNRALGGAALTVGMHLSPRLHVSYGVALFGSGQVVTFKYLLSRLWNIQIDSGTENRAALNYRLER